MHERSPPALKRQDYIIQPSAMTSVLDLGELNKYDLQVVSRSLHQVHSKEL